MLDIKTIKDQYSELGILIPLKEDSKIPNITNWTKVNDVEETFFKSNRVGIVPKDGYFVVDVDIKNGKNGVESLDQFLDLSLDSTLCQQTPSGGYHLVFKLPKDIKLKNATDIFSGIDLRIAGTGFIACYPTPGYEWLDCEEYPNTSYINEIPYKALNIIIEKLKKTKEENNLRDIHDLISNGSRNDFIVSQLGKLVSIGFGYDDILDFGLKINNTRLETPLPTSEIVTIAKSVSRYLEKDVTQEFKDIEDGKKIADSILSSKQKALQQRLSHGDKNKILLPSHVLNVGGIMGELCDYINKQGNIYQPVLTLASVISFFGVLCGNKYESPTGLKTNFYTLGLAPAGSGKDNARKCIKEICNKLNILDNLGGESIASGQGIISALEQNNCKLFMIDEFGDEMGKYLNSKSPHDKEVMSNLLKLYSTAGSVYLGKEYANKIEKGTQVIHNPIACVYGTSTQDLFYKHLSSEEALSGFLPRFLTFDTIPESNNISSLFNDKPKDKDMTRLINLMSEFLNKDSSVGTFGKYFDNDCVVEYGEGIIEYISDFRLSLNIPYNDGVKAAIYSRVVENAIKLAMLHAISLDHKKPIIRKDNFDWGKDIAVYNAQHLHSKANSLVDSNHGNYVNKVATIIKEFGSDGINHTKLVQKTRSINNKNRIEIIEQLIQSNEVVMEVKDNPGTRPTKVYYYNSID